MARAAIQRVIRATWDTNTIVSAMLAADQPETTLGRLFESFVSGACDIVITEFIVAETRSTLAKPWFRRRLGDDVAGALFDGLVETATIVPETVVVRGVAPHPKDDPVIAAALSGEVPFLVTGDRRLRAVGRYAGVAFLTPAEFAALLPTPPRTV